MFNNIGYFLMGALAGGVIGYISAAILSLDDSDEEDDQ